jgi:serine/threonine protein kinase
MLGKLLDRRYQVIDRLGVGGFGQTYVAEDTRRPGNPQCVVKHLKPARSDPNYLHTARSLFNREAETLEQLGKHDQIPTLLANFEENQEFYLVQELVVGRPLNTELHPGKSWRESQVLGLLKDVLNILKFVHSYGVIHRDLKPENLIRRASDGKLVLIDFGAVKLVRTAQITPESPMSATVAIGTPGYMPSEQGLGRPRPSSDIYALGIIAIQALTGVHPTHFQEDSTTGEIFWQNQVQVSPGLVSVLNRMVRYDYRHRYQSVNDALDAIAQLNESSVPPTILPQTPPKQVAQTQALPVLPTRQTANFNKFPLILGGMMIVVAGGVAIAYINSVTVSPLSPQNPDPPSPSPTTTVASSNEFENAQFPQSICGDPSPKNSTSQTQFYPVFIDFSENNLQRVQSSFCGDARKTNRKDTGEVAIQVASFTTASRAELFSNFMKKKLGSGNVGQPTIYAASSNREPDNCSIIVADPQAPLNVRSVPNATLGEVVGKLDNGVTVSLVAEQNGWIQISSPVSGWISKTRTKTVCK